MANQLIFSAGGSSVTVNNPQWGYESTIKLALTISERSDGTLGIYDEGATRDTRLCKCQFMVDATTLGNLNTFFSTSTQGRGNDVTLTLSRGFYPFGPDKGDTGVFTIRMISYTQSGQLFRPWKWYTVDCVMVMKTAPTYAIPSAVGEGSFQIGNVTGVRPPQDTFGALVEYRCLDVITYGGSGYAIDKGINTYNTSAIISGKEHKIGAVVNYLVATARSSAFTIVSQNGQYPFGLGKGDGSFSVKLLNNSVVIRHVDYNLMEMTLDFNYVSGPT